MEAAVNTDFVEEIKNLYPHVNIIAFNENLVLAYEKLTGKAYYFNSANGTIPNYQLIAFYGKNNHATFIWFVNVINGLNFLMNRGKFHDTLINTFHKNNHKTS